MLALVGRGLLNRLAPAMSAGLTGLFNRVWVIGPFLSKLDNWFAELGGKLVSGAGAALGRLGRGILGLFSGMSGNARAWLGMWADELARLGGNAVQRLGAAIGGAIRHPLSALGNIRNAIVGWARGTAGMLDGLGWDLISGLVRGIWAGASRVGAALASIARNALEAAKRVVGARSPSRVAAREVGAPIAQGVIEGILGQLRPLEDAARRMAAAAIPNVTGHGANLGVGGAVPALAAVSVSAGPGGSPAVHNHVTVNVAGSVVSEQQLIDVVRKGLLRVGRANGSVLAQLA